MSVVFAVAAMRFHRAAIELDDLVHELPLLRGQLREVSDEQHQLPVLVVVAAPTGHAGEADAVPDGVEQLSVGQRLRLPRAQIGRRRPYRLLRFHRLATRLDVNASEKWSSSEYGNG